MTALPAIPSTDLTAHGTTAPDALSVPAAEPISGTRPGAITGAITGAYPDANRPARSASALAQGVRSTPLPTVLLHWSLVLALAVSLATGLRIAADAPDAVVSAALAGVLPQGTVFVWHLVSGSLILAVMLAYALYQAGSGLGRRLLVRLRAGVAPPTTEGATRAARWRRLDLLLYWLAFGLLLLATVTGLMQYLGATWPRAATLEALHRTAAWGLLGYAVVHVGLQVAGGGPRRLLVMFLPRRAYVGVGALAVTVGLAVVVAVTIADRLLLHPLTLALTSTPPVLDGRPDDAAWAAAPTVRLRLANGANLPGGESMVTLRGLHDGERVYLLAQWTDPTPSTAHLPLLKTAEGWRILQTAYRAADENQFYEDKFAVMLAPSNPLAAMTSVHLGAHPLRGEPGAPGGRGLHYTTDGGILDVWHWQAVRNAAERQADDNFFGPPLPAPVETPRLADPDSDAWTPRYTAGYRKDPPGSYSGYEVNWEFFDEGLMLPLRLPDDPRDLVAPDPEPEPAPDGAATTTDPAALAGRPVLGWLEFNDTRPYAEGPDTLPVGTLLPSVLSTGPLTGDRGDIDARGHWSDGRWHLELSRRLDTGSARDVPITDGTLLWVAVFDHSQTRHAYHLRPVRIRLR